MHRRKSKCFLYTVAKISIYTIPEGEKTTATNGIAFWAGGRLVGNPSWYVGNTRVEDARRKFALRHLIVVQADCLIDDVQYDWAKFLNTESLLKSQRKEDVDINWKKRPDLVIGSGFSVSSTCIEEADANDVFCISKILIIELKKGGFTIGRGEVVQAEEYIDSIYRGNKLNCKPKIKAYVVGDSVSPAIGTHKTLENYGEVYVYTYAQLVQTASKRLFNLKNKLIERYQEMNAKDYISEILNEPKQTELVLL